MNEFTWIGRTLNGRYQIEEMLGQGGMSAVYRATDPNLRRGVAVKIIHSHLSGSPDFVRRFEEEAAAVARLRHHNIIQVFDFNKDSNTFYIVFEYIPGETLQEHLQRLTASGKRMSIEEAVRIATIIADALDYAHQRELVHRDVKPANVMLNLRGEPVLMDFGIAKIVDSTQRTATGAVMGTARYMSPEQVKGNRVDARTDLYSLGVMLYEMLSGHPPYESDSVMTMMMMHVQDPVPNILELRPEVPAALVEVLSRSMAKDPRERYATAGDMATALRNAVPRLGATIPTAAYIPPAPHQTPAPAGQAAHTPPSSATYTPPPMPELGDTGPQQKTGSGLLKWGVIGAVGALLLGVLAITALLLINAQRQRAGTPAEATATAPAEIQQPTSTPFPGVTITNIVLVNDVYVVQYNTAGFEPSGDGLHLHFFYDTTPSQEAGRPFSNFFMHGGPSPYAELLASNKPDGATQLCAVVANSDHTIQGESGNCFDLPVPAGAAQPTATSEIAALAAAETPTPTIVIATATPAPTPTDLPDPGVIITDIHLEGNLYFVDYMTNGFTEQVPGMHIHFFFNTVTPENAGAPNNGPWVVWGGPRPFNSYRVADKPGAATQMCALVANPNHTVVPASGNCFDLPQE